MNPEIVRAELQFEDPLYLSTDIGCMPYWNNESKGGDSVHNQLLTKASKGFKVDAKEKMVRAELQFNDLLCLSSDVECLPTLKYLSRVSQDEMVTRRKNTQYSMQQDLNAIREEAESELIIMSIHQESLSEIKRECPPVSNSEYSSALKGSRRGKKLEQKAHKCILPSGSLILQVSTTPEDNCNIGKITSETVMQVGLTEESQNPVVSRKQKIIRNSSRGTVHPESFATSSDMLADQNDEQCNWSSTTTTIIQSGTCMNSESHSLQESSLHSDQQRYIQNQPENDSINSLIEEMAYKQGTVRESKLEVNRRKDDES